MKLYAVSIRDSSGAFIYASHVMAEGTADARTKAAANFDKMRSPPSLASLREAGGAEMADLLASHPPISAYTVVARASKAANPSDWVS